MLEDSSTTKQEAYRFNKDSGRWEMAKDTMRAKRKNQFDGSDFLKSGVPFSEKLPEGMFLAMQKGRIEAAGKAFGHFLEARALDSAAVSYLEGLRRLLEGTAKELEVLIEGKTRKRG